MAKRARTFWWLLTPLIGLAIFVAVTAPLDVIIFHITGGYDLSCGITLRGQNKTPEEVLKHDLTVLRRRLEGLGLSGIILRSDVARRRIDIQAPPNAQVDLELIEEIVTMRGRFHIKLVVDPELLNVSEEKQKLVKDILTQKSAGTYQEEAKYDVAEKRSPRVSSSGNLWRRFVLLENPGISENTLEDAYPTTGGNGLPCLGFTMTEAGAKQLYKLSSENIGRQLAISLDGRVLQQATIQGALSKEGIITGRFTQVEIRRLVAVLKGGELNSDISVTGRRYKNPLIKGVSPAITIAVVALIFSALAVFVVLFLNLLFGSSGGESEQRGGSA